MKQGEKRIQKRWTIVLLCTVLILSVLLGLVVYARYFHREIVNKEVHTPSFYFESDLLVTGGKRYQLNPGTTQITLTLKNYADELRFSDDDVSYTLRVEGGATLSSTEGTLAKGACSSDTLTLSGLQPGGTYTVTATGTAGFVETLSATFVVLTDTEAVYQHVDTTHDAYVLLTVWTENASGTLSVSFPEGVIPDNTWEGMAEIQTNAGSFTDTLDRYSSKTYRFFKGDGYDASRPFDVRLGSLPATSGTPK